ncbi:hypothetical protein [uncultured Megasphaera sp.]|uniref:hypothetical protein n=1 Tax=uncultured Megasphaera sp. TaxID=165188 RepID=UPI00265B4617|nr:hypothetical protein [uncultured Megasphaera sp.]
MIPVERIVVNAEQLWFFLTTQQLTNCDCRVPAIQSDAVSYRQGLERQSLDSMVKKF